MKEEKTYNKQIESLLMRCLDGSATTDDHRAAWEWIQQCTENKNHYEQLREVYFSTSLMRSFRRSVPDYKWNAFKNRISSMSIAERKATAKSRRLRYYFPLLKMAAIFILAFFIGGFAFYKISEHRQMTVNNSSVCIVEAPRGSKTFVTLIDGTKVWLNAGSKLTVQRDYDQRNRDVNLEGEAFFKVAKNDLLPFHVRSSGIVVRAIGTSFNVKAYPEDNIIETTLVEGRVSVQVISDKGRNKKIMMTPNQKVSFFKETKNLALTSANEQQGDEKITFNGVKVEKNIDPALYTSWKDKRWVFLEQELADFAILLERMYDVRILFKDEELKSYSISGSFQEETIEQVLKAIQLTVPLNYVIEHNEVILTINRDNESSFEKLLKNK